MPGAIKSLYRVFLFLVNGKAPARCSSEFLLDFLKDIITSIVCLAPVIGCYDPRDAVYGATLAKSHTKRWAGVYRSSKKKNTL
jgi:hypothetical protein